MTSAIDTTRRAMDVAKRAAVAILPTWLLVDLIKFWREGATDPDRHIQAWLKLFVTILAGGHLGKVVIGSFVARDAAITQSLIYNGSSLFFALVALHWRSLWLVPAGIVGGAYISLLAGAVCVDSIGMYQPQIVVPVLTLAGAVVGGLLCAFKSGREFIHLIVISTACMLGCYWLSEALMGRTGGLKVDGRLLAFAIVAVIAALAVHYLPRSKGSFGDTVDAWFSALPDVQRRAGDLITGGFKALLCLVGIVLVLLAGELPIPSGNSGLAMAARLASYAAAGILIALFLPAASKAWFAVRPSTHRIRKSEEVKGDGGKATHAETLTALKGKGKKPDNLDQIVFPE